MLFMASVMTIGAIPSSTTPKPLTKPVATPTPMAAAAASGALASCPAQTLVKTTADAVNTQAIDRSMPPTSMTSVWPSATMPRNEASLSIAGY